MTNFRQTTDFHSRKSDRDDFSTEIIWYWKYLSKTIIL